MENNNPGPIPNPNLGAAPQVNQTISQPGGYPKESNKLVIWFVMGLVVIAVLVGGTYMYLGRQQPAIPKPQVAVSQTPAPVVKENLDSDLNNINVEDGANDFTSIDQDLQQL